MSEYLEILRYVWLRALTSRRFLCIPSANVYIIPFTTWSIIPTRNSNEISISRLSKSWRSLPSKLSSLIIYIAFAMSEHPNSYRMLGWRRIDIISASQWQSLVEWIDPSKFEGEEACGSTKSSQFSSEHTYDAHSRQDMNFGHGYGNDDGMYEHGHEESMHDHGHEGYQRGHGDH